MRSSGSPGSWPPSAAEFRCVSLTLHPHLETSKSFPEFGGMFMVANRAVLTSHAPARVRIALPRRRAEASAHARSRPACSSRHAARQTRASTRRSRRAVSICSLTGGPAQRAGSPARAASGAFSARVRHCASGPIGLPARHQGSFSSARVARRPLASLAGGSSMPGRSLPVRRARTSPTVRSRLAVSGRGRCAWIW
jgi:hypothetical protein